MDETVWHMSSPARSSSLLFLTNLCMKLTQHPYIYRCSIPHRPNRLHRMRGVRIKSNQTDARNATSGHCSTERTPLQATLEVRSFQRGISSTAEFAETCEHIENEWRLKPYGLKEHRGRS